MGLIKAALAGASSTLADTWLEFFTCESIPVDVLVVRGKKQLGKHSSNTKGNENVISDGSGIVVHEGQAMIMVDQGVVTEIATEPGVYKYESGTSPSLFSSSFGAGLKETFKEMWDRIKHGGDAAKDQRIYFFNMKELLDNKFGTQNPVPFRVTYQDLGRSFTVGVRCNGIYSYKIADPVLFYANVCGNVTSQYSRSELDSQLKSEFLDSLQPAFANISATGIRYDELPGRQREVKTAIETELNPEWKEKRGLQIEKVAINSATISEADTKRIQEFEDRAWNTNPTNAAATLVEAQAQAMQNAANNIYSYITGINAGSQNNTNNVKISKQDATTGEELPGAHLVLKNSNGDTIASFTATKAYGMIGISNSDLIFRITGITRSISSLISITLETSIESSVSAFSAISSRNLSVFME